MTINGLPSQQMPKRPKDAALLEGQMAQVEGGGFTNGSQAENSIDGLKLGSDLGVWVGLKLVLFVYREYNRWPSGHCSLMGEPRPY